MWKSGSSGAMALLVGIVLVGCGPESRRSNYFADRQSIRRVEIGSFERALDAPSQVTLDVTTRSGSVVVRRGSSSEVRIRGTISLDRRGRTPRNAGAVARRIEADPPIVRRADVIRVGGSRGRSLPSGISIDYEIEAPATTIVRLQTASGSQDVSGFTGRVSSRTASGQVRLRELRGTVTADAGSGRIIAEGIEGSLTGRTGSGRIQISRLVGSLHAESGSGSISAAGELHGLWSLQTRSGSIHLNLPEGAGFNLDARSRPGRIINNHPITLVGRLERNRMRGQVRQGGGELRLESRSGSILIE